ncbi:7480_t:CDS:1, partial [Ambispora gerdemannii]
ISNSSDNSILTIPNIIDSEISIENESTIADASTNKPTITIISTKFKKRQIKKKRQASIEKSKMEARLELEQEKHIEAEHESQRLSKMREVEERIKRFNEIKITTE